jgi:hypothetical protein
VIDAPQEFAEPWPAFDPERVADAVAALAERVAEKDVKAQLHALSAVIRNAAREQAEAPERELRSRALAAALATEDEGAVISALQQLTALNREVVRPVDWSAASGG